MRPPSLARQVTQPPLQDSRRPAQPRLQLKKTRGAPNQTLHRFGLDRSKWFEGLQGSFSTNKKPRARPSLNLAAAWSRQVQKTNKKTGERSEYERTPNPQSSRGWTAGRGMITQLGARAWLLSAPVRTLHETPETLNPKP